MNTLTHLAPDVPARALDDADQTSSDKKVAHYARNMRLMAYSYVVDGIVLFLYYLAGTISWVPAVAYTSMGLAACYAHHALIQTGRSKHWRDPYLVIPQTILSQGIQLTSMALFPEVGYMFALLLFIVYCSLTITVSARISAMACVIASTIGATILVSAEQPLQIPNHNLAEQWITFGFFALTLWRCVMIGTFNGNMTRLLRTRGEELAELTAQVDRLAHYDELTGVMNRRSLLAALGDELKLVERKGQTLTVGLLDLDHFKSVNDTLGHLAGDRTLKIFASTLAQSTRKSDRFGRYGGEEFLLVMTGTDGELAQIPIQRMRSALQAADWSAVSPNFEMTFSCGLAAHRPGDSVESLLQRADEALYLAKREGRNCTRLG